LKIGTAFHIVIGPRLAYCPKAISMKKRGIPTNTSMMKYGNRKAPERMNMKMT
jgi:hypothetical protein